MLRLMTLCFAAGLLACAVGCKSETASAPATPAGSGEEEHGHSHGEGPNGGVVADWGGGKYHVEFTVDHDAKESTVYILGGDAKSPEPIAAETVLLSIQEPAFQVDMKASPLEGEADGKSSRFVGTHDNLGIVREFAGTISGEVDGTPFAGDFQEEAHDHEHGHEH
ncbi:hypothetical protein [Blastopirellula marina]|uniref:Uncharacterized protein n=1 Tax=Blastopirellula marina TaxID=124 RepID=A0A2S8GS72_9BACT|nr:hypothetical protein [Blastopirellula marina]PQO47221.1 hypothetical protein C5Y93_04055 [Blastopirellula marina]